jgi:ATP-dependent DNA helicase PIF1
MTQQEALKILKAGKNVYLTGPAGSGKTFVINEYIQYLRDRKISVAITASTGIAATHIGGTTIHSWSGMGIKEELSSIEIDNLTQKERLYRQYKRTKVLIIDEVSMIGPNFFDSLNELAKKMKNSNEPFGGMQIILSGDFFQLPPVVRSGEQTRFIDASRAWQEMDIRVCYLNEQYRQEDEQLRDVLSEIRSGEISEPTYSMIEEIIGQQTTNGLPPTKLYTHNVDVDEVNDSHLDEIDEDEVLFELETSGRVSTAASLSKSILAPEILRLKKGAIVMFVKNNFEAGYVNGTLGKVTGFQAGLPTVKTVNGKTIKVEPATWEIEDNGKIIASVTQIPLRLAWAITVHKSQGMSLDAAEIDLSKAFVAGQGYVALSRLRSFDGLTLLGINNKALEIDPYVRALDQWLQKESDKWRKVISRFSDKDMNEMHLEFVTKCEGEIDD